MSSRQENCAVHVSSDDFGDDKYPREVSSKAQIESKVFQNACLDWAAICRVEGLTGVNILLLSRYGKDNAQVGVSMRNCRLKMVKERRHLVFLSDSTCRNS